MTADALDTRWDGFLAQIRTRFDALMRESVAGCAGLLEQTGGDTVPVSNAWQGMRMRALGLQSKISDTWSDQVQDKFHDIEAYARADAAWTRAEDLQDAMEIELERTETTIFAGAIRRLLTLAAEDLAALRCSQCGGELPAPVSLRAFNIDCPHCRSLNTVEPGPRARMAEAMAHHLWREACWSQWLSKHQAERAVHAARTPTLALLQAWERAEIEYLSAWLRERAVLFPDATASLDKELRGRLHQFYEGLGREKVWRDAGSPRRVV